MHRTAVVVAFACLAIASPAAADEGPGGRRDHTVSIELQARFGGGATWMEREPSLAFLTEHQGAGHLGASLSVRELTTGLGATVAYSHVFMGIGDRYGTHAVDLRLSERYTLVHGLRSGRPLELSVLAELGGLYAPGGATDGCFICASGSTNQTYYVTVAGVVGAIGLLLQYGHFLFGLEANYRYLVGVEGPVKQEHQVLGLLRVGIVIDV